MLFFAGAALCERRAALQSRLFGLTPAARTALWAATFLLLEIPAGWLSGWTTYLTGSGAVLAVALCFAAPEAEKPLDRPLPRYLGKISYSLYLVHRPISLVVLHLGYGLIPTGMLAGVGLALTFAVADLTNRLIEWPSQRLGRILSGDRKALPAPH